MKTIALILLSIFACNPVFACSFAKVNYFPPQNPLIKPSGNKPDAPKVEFKVVRGHLNGASSCSDTGSITIMIPAQGYDSHSTGYFFEVISSTEKQQIFPTGAIFGNSKSKDGVNSYTFPWIDGSSDVQEPLEVIVNVYRVGLNWVLSDPAELVIGHHGSI